LPELTDFACEECGGPVMGEISYARSALAATPRLVVTVASRFFVAAICEVLVARESPVSCRACD
jgi:hypothetical protein